MGEPSKIQNQLSVDPIQSTKKYHARNAKDRLRTDRTRTPPSIIES